MKRRLLIAAIFLLAGAVVTVGVAWGLARWSDWLEVISFLSSDESPGLPSSGTPAATESNPSAWRLDNVPETWPDKPRLEVTYRMWWYLFTDQISPLDDTKLSTVSLHELRFGVPTKSLACYELGGNESGTWTYSWRYAWGRLGGEHPLPLRLIWPDFAVNTFFYAAILWLLIPGPFALRRFIRVRRSLCPKCAYPRGESAVCSECGHELPQRVRPAT